MVKDHSDSEKGNLLPPHRLLFPINSKGYFICTIPDRIAHTTAFVTPVVEHWLEGEIECLSDSQRWPSPWSRPLGGSCRWVTPRRSWPGPVGWGAAGPGTARPWWSYTRRSGRPWGSRPATRRIIDWQWVTPNYIVNSAKTYKWCNSFGLRTKTMNRNEI